MEIATDLHWIECRRGMTPARNVYTWVDAGVLVLVDTGMPGDEAAILDYIRRIGHRVTDIAAILITHADVDHAGGLADLHKQSRASIYSSPGTAALLNQGKAPKHMPRPVQFIMDRFFGYTPVARESIRVVESGEALPGLEDWNAIATPGHTLDHISYWSNLHGVLFAGDALNTRGGQLNCSSRRATADPEAARESAVRLLRLSPSILACGHGRPMQNHDANDLIAFFHQLQKPIVS